MQLDLLAILPLACLLACELAAQDNYDLMLAPPAFQGAKVLVT